MPIGLRIKQARRRRGLSLRALGDAAGVSHTTISKYEKGQSSPDSATLIAISRALDTGLDFFLRPARVGDISPAYRKLSRLTQTKLGQVEEAVRDWLERYLEAERLSPSAGDFRFESPEGFPRTVRSFDGVERAALDLREAWDIGLDPIEDLTALMEDKGVRVGLVDDVPDGFDACAFTADVNGGVPVVAMREGLPGDRQRFTLAHELGHLVLAFEEDGAEERWGEERACHRFAGAFLAPAPTLLRDLGEHRTNFTGAELHMLKHKYGMSMQALVHRAHDLGVISDAFAARVYREFSKQGWRKAEPGEPVAEERPSRFRRLVLQALAEDVIGRPRAAQLYKGELETASEREAFGEGELEAA